MKNFNYLQQQDILRKIYFSHLNSERTPFLFESYNEEPKKIDGIQLQQEKNKRHGLISGHKTQTGIKKGIELAQQKIHAWNDFLSIWEEKPEHIYIWSDLHLFHRNICRYSGRPFLSVEEMNNAMLENALSALNEDDILLFGGDISFGNKTETKIWLNQIPNKKYLILGNHDVDRQDKLEWIQKLGFEGIIDCLYLPHKTDKHKKQHLWITHYPIPEEKLNKHVINVYGHVHQKLFRGSRVNMCVEHTDYKPVQLKTMIENHKKDNLK